MENKLYMFLGPEDKIQPGDEYLFIGDDYETEWLDALVLESISESLGENIFSRNIVRRPVKIVA
jgi:hypothetical protein